MGKTRLIAETGAGQHGVATATAAALMGMECVVYMGKEDTERQALNVYRMRLLGATVIPVTTGTGTLKDACSACFREWTNRISDTHYCLGSVMGPHPFPTIVRDFQAVISKEIKEQLMEKEGKLPDAVIACVGGGSNAIGAFYNFIMLKGQDLFGAMKKIPAKYRIVFPFVVSGIVCYTLPSILAGGHAMISLITGHTLLVSTMLLLLVAKFFFSAFCFGSGAPGGIFFPLLILGAYLGAIYGTLVIQASGIPSYYLVNFITISMAGFFTAIVRAPITGILLIAEMTGTFEHFLSLAVVCIISYLVAHLLKSEPIYESLLGRILAKNGFKESEDADHKVLRGFAVGTGSIAAKQLVKDIPWPEHCLIVTLNRGDEEIIARGSTEIHVGDTIIALIDDNYLGMVTESIQLICGEIIPE